jgi:hypothetical protein
MLLEEGNGQAGDFGGHIVIASALDGPGGGPAAVVTRLRRCGSVTDPRVQIMLKQHLMSPEMISKHFESSLMINI